VISQELSCDSYARLAGGVCRSSILGSSKAHIRCNESCGSQTDARWPSLHIVRTERLDFLDAAGVGMETGTASRPTVDEDNCATDGALLSSGGLRLLLGDLKTVMIASSMVSLNWSTIRPKCSCRDSFSPATQSGSTHPSYNLPWDPGT